MSDLKKSSMLENMQDEFNRKFNDAVIYEVLQKDLDLSGENKDYVVEIKAAYLKPTHIQFLERHLDRAMYYIKPRAREVAVICFSNQSLTA